MKIAVSTGLYYKKNCDEVLDMIAKTKCKNIELFLNQTFIDLSLDEIEDEINKRNLKVTSIHLPLTFIAYDRGEDEEFWIKRGIEYAERLNASTIVTHFFYKEGDKTKNNDESHLGNIKKYSNRNNKYICTENLPNIPTETKLKSSEELKKFLVENNAHMTFDTTHTATHGRSILKEYENYKKHIRNIHLSDYKDGNEHKVIGDGDLPIKELIRKLVEDDYKHTITLEYDFENEKRNNVNSMEEAVELINKSVEYIEGCL